jgi:predicted nucleic acid-binding protein
MKDRCFFDTNLLVYLYSEDEAEKRSEVIDRLTDTASPFISTQVLQELSNVLLKKFKLTEEKVAEVLKEIESSFFIWPNSFETVQKALSIKKRYGYSFYDALIIVSAIDSGCAVLYSEDLQHGQIIEDRLQILNPFKAS